MTNTQLLTLIITILGSNFAVLLYLSSRIDRVESVLSARLDHTSEALSGRIDRLGDKLETINKALGKHEADLEALKKPRTGTGGD